MTPRPLPRIHDLPAGTITALLTLALVVTLAGSALAQPDEDARRVWLDVDPANGIGEVDDGLAMVQAFHSPELEIAGVSAVYGNTSIDNAYPIALNVTRVFGPEGLDAHRGAAGPDDLGEPNDATRAMARALEQGPMTIAALGPVTNVATLLQNRPELADRIDEIVVVAGRRSADQAFISTDDQPEPFSDFNFENDPAAMQVILDSDIPLVMAPWEVSSHVWLTRDDLARLQASGGSGLWIAATTQQWIDHWEHDINARGGNPFDTLAIGYLTHPELINGMPVTASIKRAVPPGADTDQEMPYLIAQRANNSETDTVYLHTPEPGFKPMLMKRLAGPRGLE